MSDVVTAAERVEAAVEELGAAYGDFVQAIEQRKRAAWHQAGPSGAADVSALAGGERIADEVAGLLVAAGLGTVLNRGSPPHVIDFVARWRERETTGQLATRRSQ